MMTKEELIGCKFYRKSFNSKRYYTFIENNSKEEKLTICWNKEQGFDYNGESNNYSVKNINDNINNGNWILLKPEEQLLTTIL